MQKQEIISAMGLGPVRAIGPAKEQLEDRKIKPIILSSIKITVALLTLNSQITQLGTIIAMGRELVSFISRVKPIAKTRLGVQRTSFITTMSRREIPNALWAPKYRIKPSETTTAMGCGLARPMEFVKEQPDQPKMPLILIPKVHGRASVQAQ